MRPLVPVLFALGALLVSSCDDGPWTQRTPAYPGDVELPPEYRPKGDEFLVVVIPDTQAYASGDGTIFEGQMRWIADHADEYRIVFVSHVGDIVSNADAPNEWTVARAAYDYLEDVDMPRGFSVAAHDVWRREGSGHDASCSPFARTDCDALDYLEHFGPERYAGRDWFGGASPSGQSSYQRIDVEGMRLLFLHLPQDVPQAEADWANEILDANPGTLAHLTTHRYLFDYRLTTVMPPPLSLLPAGRFNGLTYELGGQLITYDDGLSVQRIFDEIVDAHPNIWGVHCGHVDAEFRQSVTNAEGLPVHEILVDFQNMSDGGGGWLRVLRFKPSEDQVEVFTFSTLTGAVRANGDGFEHAIDILEDYAGQVGDFVDPEVIEELRTDLRDPTSEFRALYQDSLYFEGKRDSSFVLDVPFQRYIDASR